MESKHKNALIGGLLAIVFIMAVGFAGFTQRLTITDETTVSSNWNIGFESAVANPACSDSVTTTCGSVTAFEAQARSLTFNTNLASPGDTVTYTVVVKNYGNVAAKIAANGITMTPTNADSLITYSQSGLTAGTTTLDASGGANDEVEFTVTVTFPQTDGYVETSKMQNGLTMYIDWEEA